MTYRERRLAKAERLRGWADKREEKSDASYQRANSIAEMIPFGQPILVGHHSEKRHRRDLARIDNGMRGSIEHAKKADEMRSRADNIEDAAERAIYDDDPDAIERLTARIDELEAKRGRIKAFNAAVRKSPHAPDYNHLTDKEKKDYISTIKSCPYMLGKNGEFPAFTLTNLSGNINRQKKRLARLERKKNASQ